MNLGSICNYPITSVKNSAVGFKGAPKQNGTVKQPQRMTHSDDGRKLTVKDGVVYTDDGERFSGYYSFTDKDNRKFVLHYEYGLLYMVEKDGKADRRYKRYEDEKDANGEIINYDSNLSLIPKRVYTLGYHNLADGSRIPTSELYGYDNKRAKCTYIYDFKNKTTTYLAKNPNAEHRGEPIAEVYRRNDDYTKKIPDETRITRKKDGPEVKIFENLDEARKYFKDEYGIIHAQFDTIAQAQIAKAAVDDFVELLGDKKCLQRLHFETKDLDKNTTAAFAGIPMPTYLIGETIPPMIKHKPCELSVIPVILFNKKIDYNNEARIRAKGALKHDFSSPTLKGYIHHEIGHYLHCASNPKNYFYGKNEHTSKGKVLAGEVSKYAQKDTEEFVAEYIAGRMAGKKYPKEVDEYYLECGGPDIFDKDSK